jgi:hypothetical protein
MAVFPKKPSEGGGCTIDHTQTTSIRRYQGRVSPTTTSLAVPGDVATLALQVFACILRQHRGQR